MTDHLARLWHFHIEFGWQSSVYSDLERLHLTASR